MLEETLTETFWNATMVQKEEKQMTIDEAIEQLIRAIFSEIETEEDSAKLAKAYGIALSSLRAWKGVLGEFAKMYEYDDTGFENEDGSVDPPLIRLDVAESIVRKYLTDVIQEGNDNG